MFLFKFRAQKEVERRIWLVHNNPMTICLTNNCKITWAFDIFVIHFQGVEPWTFEQKLGEAVFIPAGCPHQVRNLKVRNSS